MKLSKWNRLACNRIANGEDYFRANSRLTESDYRRIEKRAQELRDKCGIGELDRLIVRWQNEPAR